MRRTYKAVAAIAAAMTLAGLAGCTAAKTNSAAAAPEKAAATSPVSAAFASADDRLQATLDLCHAVSDNTLKPFAGKLEALQAGFAAQDASTYAEARDAYNWAADTLAADQGKHAIASDTVRSDIDELVQALREIAISSTPLGDPWSQSDLFLGSTGAVVDACMAAGHLASGGAA